MASKLKIIHRETGQSLRQYAKTHKLTPINWPGRPGSGSIAIDFSDCKLHYIQNEDGKPGFWYNAGNWGGDAVMLLSPAEFEVIRATEDG